MARLSPPGRGGAFEKWAIRLLLPALLLGMVLLAMSLRGGLHIDWGAFSDGPERGTWRAESFDGEDVFDFRFSIVVREGQIVGGRDGCNYWSFAGEPDPRTGERMIESTLAACAETPETRIYGALGRAPGAQLALRGDDRLEVRNLGHTGMFRRWSEDDDKAEQDRDFEAARRANPPERPVSASRLPSTQTPPAPRAIPPRQLPPVPMPAPDGANAGPPEKEPPPPPGD